MAHTRRHQAALAAAGLFIAVHAAARSSGDDRLYFGSIGSCEAVRGGAANRIQVRTHAPGLDFLVLAGAGDLLAAYVLPVMGGGSCDEAGAIDRRSRSQLYLQYLNAGFRLAPVSVQDANSRTVVLAASLTERAIAQSIIERRVYASADRNLEVHFSINGHRLGSVVPLPPGTPLRIEVRLKDPDEPSAYYWVSLRHDEVGGPLESASEVSGTDLRGDGTVVFTQFRRRESDEYFLLQVSQGERADAAVVWVAPIWLVSRDPAANSTISIGPRRRSGQPEPAGCGLGTIGHVWAPSITHCSNSSCECTSSF